MSYGGRPFAKVMISLPSSKPSQLTLSATTSKKRVAEETFTWPERRIKPIGLGSGVPTVSGGMREGTMRTGLLSPRLPTTTKHRENKVSPSGRVTPPKRGSNQDKLIWPPCGTIFMFPSPRPPTLSLKDLISVKRMTFSSQVKSISSAPTPLKFLTVNGRHTLSPGKRFTKGSENSTGLQPGILMVKRASQLMPSSIKTS